MNIKKIIVSLSFVMALFCASVYAKTLEFTIDSNVLKVKEHHIITADKLLVSPYIANDRTMVPVRVISEQLGAKIGWNGETQEVSINQNGKIITLTIGSTNADVNGVSTQLDTAPVIVNDTTLIPVRFVSESLGYNVEYMPVTNQLTVSDNPYIATVGNTKISYDTFEVVFDMFLSSYSGIYSYEVIGEYTIDYLNQIYALYDYAVSSGVTLSKLEYAGVAQIVEQILDEMPNQWLSSVYADLCAKIELIDKFSAYLYQNMEQMNNTNIEEYYYNNYLKTKHVYIDKENDNARKLALEVGGKASRGTDFDFLVEKYTQDNNSKNFADGILFTYGQMPEEYVEAAMKLAVGKVSSAVETDEGYYIIKRLKLDPYTVSLDGHIVKAATDIAYNNYLMNALDNTEYKQYFTTGELVKMLTE